MGAIDQCVREIFTLSAGSMIDVQARSPVETEDREQRRNHTTYSSHGLSGNFVQGGLPRPQSQSRTFPAEWALGASVMVIGVQFRSSHAYAKHFTGPLCQLYVRRVRGGPATCSRHSGPLHRLVPQLVSFSLKGFLYLRQSLTCAAVYLIMKCSPSFSSKTTYPCRKR